MPTVCLQGAAKMSLNGAVSFFRELGQTASNLYHKRTEDEEEDAEYLKVGMNCYRDALLLIRFNPCIPYFIWNNMLPKLTSHPSAFGCIRCAHMCTSWNGT
jgi:hypothetical protein